jgi:hypothetical protein
MGKRIAQIKTILDTANVDPDDIREILKQSQSLSSDLDWFANSCLIKTQIAINNRKKILGIS